MSRQVQPSVTETGEFVRTRARQGKASKATRRTLIIQESSRVKSNMTHDTVRQTKTKQWLKCSKSRLVTCSERTDKQVTGRPVALRGGTKCTL